MKYLLLLPLFFIGFARSQVTVSYELIQSYTIAEIQDIIDGIPLVGLFIEPTYEVDFYRVHYKTEYLDSFVTVSGALALPKGMDCKAPIYSYQHGTTSSKLDVPSYGSAELNICLLFASEGNILTAPDHIGLGSSTIDIHPYCHGFSEAHTTINLLRATRELMADELAGTVEASNQLFMFGYSQGGFSTAAAAKYIEEYYPEEFDVTAIAPMSGPYNIPGVQTDFVNSGEPYATPGYLPYIILGYQSVYGNLYNETSDVFIEPYDTLMPYLFFGHNYSMGHINGEATPIPTDMFHPEVVQLIEDGNHPFYDALVDNDLLDWKPQTRVNMYYCTEDEQVTYENALVAEESWSEDNDFEINAIDLGAFDHSGCLLFALLNGREFFQSLENNGIDFELTYNEEENQFELSFPFNNQDDYSIVWSDNSTGATLEGIDPDALYTVTVTDNESGCSHTKSISVNPLSTKELDSNFEVVLYPNPATSIVNVQLNEVHEINLTIVDMSGRKVFGRNNVKASDITINVDSLESGNYLLQIDNGGQRVVQQFVKQ